MTVKVYCLYISIKDPSPQPWLRYFSHGSGQLRQSPGFADLMVNMGRLEARAAKMFALGMLAGIKINVEWSFQLELHTHWGVRWPCCRHGFLASQWKRRETPWLCFEKKHGAPTWRCFMISETLWKDNDSDILMAILAALQFFE